jgi:hypothetical protein
VNEEHELALQPVRRCTMPLHILDDVVAVLVLVGEVGKIKSCGLSLLFREDLELYLILQIADLAQVK